MEGRTAFLCVVGNNLQEERGGGAGVRAGVAGDRVLLAGVCVAGERVIVAGVQVGIGSSRRKKALARAATRFSRIIVIEKWLKLSLKNTEYLAIYH